MADRVEREIEEILAKLETGLPPEADKKPISILSGKKRRPGPVAKAKQATGRKLNGISATTMMFTGAALVVGGLVLSSVFGALIWVSFAGVVLFLGAFLSSFFRQAPAKAAPPKGVFWRDRYIEYEPASPGFFGRLKRVFRR